MNPIVAFNKMAPKMKKDINEITDHSAAKNMRQIPRVRAKALVTQLLKKIQDNENNTQSRELETQVAIPQFFMGQLRRALGHAEGKKMEVTMTKCDSIHEVIEKCKGGEGILIMATKEKNESDDHVRLSVSLRSLEDVESLAEKEQPLGLLFISFKKGAGRVEGTHFGMKRNQGDLKVAIKLKEKAEGDETKYKEISAKRVASLVE